MDARKNMLIIKGEIVTSRVSYCTYNSALQKWNVTYQGGKTFCYAYRNVEWLKNPISKNPKSIHIIYRGKSFDNVTEILVFAGAYEEYWHICFSTGYENDYNVRDLSIEKSCLEDGKSKSVFSYLRQIASYISVKNEDDTAILSKQYEKIDFLSDENAISAYLKPEKYAAATGLDANTLIFPFGCNKSQYHAVEQAILNRISVIEGPPGTGKTQTILNIVANLLIRNQTVQIVSNNNSAIENIIEKLASPKYAFDFFAASLGRNEKKQNFIKSQTGSFPDFSKWKRSQCKDTPNGIEIKAQSETLQKIYNDQTHLAELFKEKQTAEIEQKHFVAAIGLSLADDFILHKKSLSSGKILQLYQEIESYLSGKTKMNFLKSLRLWLSFGVSFKSMERHNKTTLLSKIQMLYYQKRMAEIDSEIDKAKQALKDIDADALREKYIKDSLSYFREFLAQKFGAKGMRRIYEEDDLWKKPEDFLNDYPVVLSTTYTARSSLGKKAQFDYVIMDEASQVDVATGALAMSCARNAVIVGDNKQLPNVVTKEQKESLRFVFAANSIPDAYDFTKYSFLDSICELLKEKIPKTFLSEHYRCDPKIIGFCNQKFYNDELVIMTSECMDSLELITTVAGNHEREKANQRQAEIIKKDILPLLEFPYSEVGVIAPYRNQVALLKEELAAFDVEIDTVHKFQGREKDVIIFSTTDDLVTEFSDDPNLLNVVVSRAKKKLIIVASEMEQPVGSNVGDLIGYIRYHNCIEKHSNINSVFDYLYSQNEKQRLEFLKKHKRISEFDSENLFFALIEDELKKRENTIGVVCHQPLYLLFSNLDLMNDDEKRFVNTGLSHVDFLIYNTVTKQPLLGIEVDGYSYHKANSEQGKRDQLKNHIFDIYQIPLLRFKTNGSGEKTVLENALNQICGESARCVV